MRGPRPAAASSYESDCNVQHTRTGECAQAGGRQLPPVLIGVGVLLIARRRSAEN